MPWNHELFQERTLLDLLVEYQIDKFEEKPIEAHRNKDGEIQLKDTGDDLVDKWEEQIAMGDEPNLEEAFAPGGLEQIKLRKGKSSVLQRAMTIRDTWDTVEAIQQHEFNKTPIKTFGDDY